MLGPQEPTAMGHARLGDSLPNTRPWRKVVGHIADGVGAAGVAQATAEAAGAALNAAQRDPAMARIVFLLAKTVLAAREEDFCAELERHGIRVPSSPSIYDLTAGFSDAFHEWHSTSRVLRTDFGEMAELAATEAMTRCANERSLQLIPTGDELQNAFRALSTPKGFSRLAHEFFARFTQRFLHFHLDRELPHHMGGNGRFPDRKARNEFVEDLETHCREAALIVKQYSADWFSKANFEDGITESRAKIFSQTCIKKLRKELLIRGVQYV